MDMDVEGKKLERSKAKMAVTVASRRLIGAVNREGDYDILRDLMIDLEKVYDDFCNVNKEYEIIVCEEKYAEHRVVNGEDIKTYRDSVNKSYQDARGMFAQVKTAKEDTVRKQVAAPVIAALKNGIHRIRELIIAVDENLESDKVNLQALHLDKNDLQLILEVICDNMTKLCSIESQGQDIPIQHEVDEIVGVVYNRTRKINLLLHDQTSCHKSSTVDKLNLNEASVQDPSASFDANEATLNNTNPSNNSDSVISPSTDENSTSSLDTINTSASPQAMNTTTSPQAINTTMPQVTLVTTTNITQGNSAITTSPSISSVGSLNTSAHIFVPTNTIHSESTPSIDPSGETHLFQQSQLPASLSNNNPIGTTTSRFAIPLSNHTVAAPYPYSSATQFTGNFSTYPIYTSLMGQ